MRLFGGKRRPRWWGPCGRWARLGRREGGEGQAFRGLRLIKAATQKGYSMNARWNQSSGNTERPAVAGSVTHCLSLTVNRTYWWQPGQRPTNPAPLHHAARYDAYWAASPASS